MKPIKAKYPSLDRPYMKTRRQGYGSGKSQTTSAITNNSAERDLSFDHDANFNK